jgi:hypothetical protein
MGAALKAPALALGLIEVIADALAGLAWFGGAALADEAEAQSGHNEAADACSLSQPCLVRSQRTPPHTPSRLILRTHAHLFQILVSDLDRLFCHP